MKIAKGIFLLFAVAWADWELCDSVRLKTIIPERGSFYIAFDDPHESLFLYLPYDSLTNLAKAAVARSPAWLRVDLAENFRRLSPETQDLYANLLLSSSHPYVDEVSFQVAHISPQLLTSSDFYPEVLVENVRYIYKNDSFLDYVEVIDYGTPISDTNYYSTVRYRVAVGESIFFVQQPKETYYWFILHPKISREISTYVDSLTGNPLPPPRGKFWRGYLFYNADPNYPVLKDYLLGVTTLWNSLRNDTANNGAIGAINNWLRRVMEFRSPSRRTYQPVQIYTQHHGTCTEWGILTPAVARSALIPCVHTRAYGNNHAWDEFYERRWVQWEPVNKMIDDTTRYDPGWWNLGAACDWRGDGYWWTVSERYTPHCTLTVRVLDVESLPVDGARVLIAGGTQPVNYFSAFAYTDSDGEARFTLGDTNNYDAAIESELGNISYTRVITQARPDTHYRAVFSLPARMPVLPLSSDTFPSSPLNRYKVEVEIRVGNEIIFGTHPDDNSFFKERRGLGALHFFIADSLNFYRYCRGLDFRAFLNSPNITRLDTSFIFPTESPYYLVFTSEERIGNGVDVAVAVRLFRGVSGLKEEKARRKKENSFISQIFPLKPNERLFNAVGKLVNEKKRLPPGVYFLERGKRILKKIIFP